MATVWNSANMARRAIMGSQLYMEGVSIRGAQASGTQSGPIDITLPDVTPALTDGEYKVGTEYTLSGATANPSGVDGVVAIQYHWIVDGVEQAEGTTYTPDGTEYGTNKLSWRVYYVESGGDNDGTAVRNGGLADVTDVAPTVVAGLGTVQLTESASPQTIDTSGVFSAAFGATQRDNSSLPTGVTFDPVAEEYTVAANTTVASQAMQLIDENLDGFIADDWNIEALSDAPSWTVQPTLDPTSGAEGVTFQLNKGTATATDTVVYTLEQLLVNGVDKSAQVVDQGTHWDWDSTGSLPGAIVYQVRATNAFGNPVSDVINGTLTEPAAVPVITNLTLIETPGQEDVLNIEFAADTELPVTVHFVTTDSGVQNTPEEVRDGDAANNIESESWSEDGTGHTFINLTPLSDGTASTPVGTCSHMQVVAENAAGLGAVVVSADGSKLNFSPPTITAAAVEDATPGQVDLTASKALYPDNGDEADWTVNVEAGSTSVTAAFLGNQRSSDTTTQEATKTCSFGALGHTGDDVYIAVHSYCRWEDTVPSSITIDSQSAPPVTGTSSPSAGGAYRAGTQIFKLTGHTLNATSFDVVVGHTHTGANDNGVTKTDVVLFTSTGGSTDTGTFGTITDTVQTMSTNVGAGAAVVMIEGVKDAALSSSAGFDTAATIDLLVGESTTYGFVSDAASGGAPRTMTVTNDGSTIRNYSMVVIS